MKVGVGPADIAHKLWGLSETVSGGITDRLLANIISLNSPAEMICCTCSAHITIGAWCDFIQPVRHVYSLVQANAKYWQVDTGSDT